MTSSGDTHFDAVVIGSGFGGSVTTYRLAEAGKRVLLLERGHRYPPGSFPRSPYRFSRAFWDPSAGLYGMLVMVVLFFIRTFNFVTFLKQPAS